MTPCCVHVYYRLEGKCASVKVLHGFNSLLPPNGKHWYTSVSATSSTASSPDIYVSVCRLSELGLVIKVVDGFLEIEPVHVGFFFPFFLAGCGGGGRAVRGTVRHSYPDFNPVRRGLEGQCSLQRHQMCAVMESEERGAFCEASDKPCSQSRPGSGVISGRTRGRNPNPAHRIGFLFTRA